MNRTDFREICSRCGARVGLWEYVRVLERFEVVDWGKFSELAKNINCNCW